MACSEEQVVVFRGGFSAAWPVVRRLLDLEARGARFELLNEVRFRVVPPTVLTAEDVEFLRIHRDEARLVLEYVESGPELEPEPIADAGNRPVVLGADTNAGDPGDPRQKRVNGGAR